MTPAGLFFGGGHPADLLITGAHVLDPRGDLDGPGDVLVRAGEIAQIGAAGTLQAPAEAELIEAAGLHLFPGFFDPHVHLRAPGQEHKEDLASGTAAAAAGGFSAVIAMPNTTPVVDDASILRSVREAAERQARVPTGLLAAATRGSHGAELTEMAELRDAGALGFSDDGRPLVAAGMLRRALQYQRLCGGVLSLHEEDPSLSGPGVMHEGAVSARLGMAGIPSISEATFVARDAMIAAHEAGRAHFQHLSCRESVAALRAWKAAGARVSGEASPHHLTLTDDAVRSLDPNFKMNPPLRAEEDRRALIDGLTDGTIDCIATDHAPHAPHEKDVPFEQAPMGVTGLETAFAALYTELVAGGALRLALLIEKLTAGAALYDLQTPRVAAGMPANLALIDLGAEYTVGAEGYVSRSANCCFEGRTLSGVVRMTLAAGAIVHRAAIATREPA